MMIVSHEAFCIDRITYLMLGVEKEEKRRTITRKGSPSSCDNAQECEESWK
jgi:hypothetical protein